MKSWFKVLTVVAFTLVIGQLGAGANAQSGGDDVLSQASVLRDPDLAVLGNPKGDITIVEYFDYQCPYCKKLHPIILQVVKEDGNVRFVPKDWPIFGDLSKYAARMALAAKFQGKYDVAHAALLTTKSRLTESSVPGLLAAAGVDVERAKSDLQTNQQTIENILSRNNAQAEGLGFQGTPAFIIGTFRVSQVLDTRGFKQAIKDARALKK